MQGLTIQSLKKHRALVPLFFCLGVGCFGAVFYTARLAFRNPDVGWFRKSGKIPNEEFSTKQYKFYSPTLDYNKIESEAPKF